MNQRKWYEAKTADFIVYSDAGEKYAREAAINLEQFRVVIQKAMPSLRLTAAEPTIVFAARDENTMKALLPEMWEGRGKARPAGVFEHGWEQSHAVLRLDYGEISYEVIRHEYFHNLESLNFVALPTWLNEGMAEFFGNSVIDKKDAKLGMPSPRIRYLRETSPIPLKELLTADASSPYYQNDSEVAKFYAQSWALTHMLMVGPGMENGRKLNDFIALLHKKSDEIAAFEQTFGNLKTVQNQFDQYIRKFEIAVLVLHDPPQADEKGIVSRQLSPEEINADLAEFYRATYHKKEAERYLAEAENAKEQIPMLHRTKAFMAFSEGKDTEAMAEFERAVAADPSDYLSLYYATMLRSETKPGNQSLVIEGMKRVRAIKPNFAPAHVELARAYLQAGQLADADAAAMTAAQAEQGRAGYWLLWAKVKLARGDAGSAARLARYVAERWSGTDRDQAIEIWKEATAQDPKSALPSLAVTSDAPAGTTVEGNIESVKCEEKKPIGLSLKTGEHIIYLSSENGKPFRSGFEDTIWFGRDHFSLCHHVEGRRAVVTYKPDGDGKGIVQQIRVEDSLETRRPLAAGN